MWVMEHLQTTNVFSLLKHTAFFPPLSAAQHRTYAEITDYS